MAGPFIDGGTRIGMLRGEAFNAYAGLEMELLRALISFGDMNPEVASLIFYKIANARARNQIVDQLKKRAWADRCNIFWNSLIKEIGLLDQERNELAHWHIRRHDPVMHGEWMIAGYALSPPNIYAAGKPKTEEDLRLFVHKCGYASALVGVFITALYDDSSLFERSPWREKFQQPLAYPPLSPRP